MFTSPSTDAQPPSLVGFVPVLLELLLELPRLTMTDLDRVDEVVGLLELDRPVADVFT